MVESLLAVDRLVEAEAALKRFREVPDALAEDPRLDLIEASIAVAAGSQQRQAQALDRTIVAAEARGRRALLVDALLQRSRLYIRDGRLDRATELCDRAEQAAGKTEQLLVEILGQKARLALARGNREEAMEIYRRIQELEQPTDPVLDSGDKSTSSTTTQIGPQDPESQKTGSQ